MIYNYNPDISRLLSLRTRQFLTANLELISKPSKMSNTELPKGTVETVDYINVSLPANTPRGHPHIIEYNIEGETEAPADLNCVDAIATVLRYENPRCLHKLLDVKNVTIVALATGIARKSLCSTHIIRKARDVWVSYRRTS